LLSSALRTSIRSRYAVRRSSPLVLVPLFSVTLLLSALAYGAEVKKYSAGEAAYHVGEEATVCGVVVSTKWATRATGQPTFLNLDRPYPNQIFTVVIWGSDRGAFGAPETQYAKRRICVTGKIREYRSKPEIVVNDPSQVVVE
jgi:DNA/RNA endonuclease YhcR with UshA esterase domain